MWGWKWMTWTASTRLLAASVPFVSGPVALPFSVAGVRKWLCYARDLDGALVELGVRAGVIYCPL